PDSSALKHAPSIKKSGQQCDRFASRASDASFKGALCSREGKWSRRDTEETCSESLPLGSPTQPPRRVERIVGTLRSMPGSSFRYSRCQSGLTVLCLDFGPVVRCRGSEASLDVVGCQTRSNRNSASRGRSPTT